MPRFKRNERINEITDLQSFIASWANPDSERNKNDVVIHKTEYGNINSTGEIGNYEGYALTKNHGQFLMSIEEGIRELVVLLIEKFNLITYTSCEGHFYKTSNISPVERHVGFIIPEKEGQNVLEKLQAAADKVNDGNFISAVKIVIRNEKILSSGKWTDTTEIFFAKRRAFFWSSYFNKLAMVYHKFLITLKNA